MSSSKHDQRWLHAKRWAESLKRLFDTGQYLIAYDNQYFEPRLTKVVINETLRTIMLAESESTTDYQYLLFDMNSLKLDMKSYKEQVIDKLALYKKEPVKFN